MTDLLNGGSKMATSVIRRLGVLSVAKLQGALYALLGLIVGAVFALFSLFGAALGNALGSGSHGNALFGAAFGLGAVVLFPILYGVIGFIAGLVVAALYNLVAGVRGGRRVVVSGGRSGGGECSLFGGLPPL